RDQLGIDVLDTSTHAFECGLTLRPQLFHAVGGGATGRALAVLAGLGVVLGELLGGRFQLLDIGFQGRGGPLVRSGAAL
ncbi:hypothetical protein, partial [Mesorhizobium sp. GbtcB19]|uniref:hypothetical protein n=1 Tax=Mesorhizobium sp. GbtcB19 TaxID=2824764 RepID=UPI001C2F4377